MRLLQNKNLINHTKEKKNYFDKSKGTVERLLWLVQISSHWFLESWKPTFTFSAKRLIKERGSNSINLNSMQYTQKYDTVCKGFCN